MKVNLKSLVFMALLVGSTTSYAQLTAEDTSNQRISGLHDGEEFLKYHFDHVTDYKLMRAGEGVLMKGIGKSAELGVLTPGSYAMMYTRKDGRVVLDRFEVAKK